MTGDLINGEKYNFLDLHAHWGTSGDDGTEHSIDGQKFSTELHLVHINSRYKNLSEALNYVDGVLVVGLLFEVNVNICAIPCIILLQPLFHKNVLLLFTGRRTS